MSAQIKKAIITVVLVVLTGWLLNYSWSLRQIRYKNYTFSPEEAKRLQYFPRAQYAHGYQAWIENNAEQAASYFKQAIAHDVFYIDAWLKLAQTDLAEGDKDHARAIVRHIDQLTGEVLQWKWPQTLLALELGMDELFVKNINYLIQHQHMRQNALYLMDRYYKSTVRAVIRSLHPDNLTAYLEWLIRWNRLDDTLVVWEEITRTGMPGHESILRYVTFLISKNAIPKARDIWHAHTDIMGMTNPGFETEMTGQGFDWRHTPAGINFEIHRVRSANHSGLYAVQISFLGRENTQFHHLFQVVPVTPLHAYRLTYAWRSRELTTDQGPFMEIYGYGGKGLYEKGPMMIGTHEWNSTSIAFTPPEWCHAIVVRCRRNPSGRFDRNIQGTLWLDDFRLEESTKEP
jgi:hypothetical protein